MGSTPDICQTLKVGAGNEIKEWERMGKWGEGREKKGKG
jgi:hypothetical protein